MNTDKLSLILIAVLAPATWAIDYFPLQTGNQWSYTMSNGVQMIVAVTGAAPVRGVRCAIVETTVGWRVSREYVALEADGLKTYKTQAQGQEFVYDPPVTRVKLPLQQGQTWTSTVQQSGTSITTTNRALGTERVQTPAGVFDCVKISSTAAIPGQPPMVSVSYYAPGVGLVYQSVQAGGQELIATLAGANIKPSQSPPTAPDQPQPPEPPQQTQPGAPARQAIPAETPQAEHCPKCNTKLPAGAKFCPACGEKITLPAASDTAGGEEEPVPEPQMALEQYQSPDGTVRLYKPIDWIVQQETYGAGAIAVSVVEPQEDAAVVFMTFPVDQGINDSVQLMAQCMIGLRQEYPDIQATRVSSSADKERTIAQVTLTADGKQGLGHGYFFYTQRVGTVYFLLARVDMWDRLHPMMTSVAANLAYAPEGIATVARQGQALATQTSVASGPMLSPAAMIQQASRRPGRQVPLHPVALRDQSLMLQIPQGWSLQGQKLQFTTFNDPQTKMYGVGSGHHTIIPTQMRLPGTINAPYQPPLQALRLVLELGQVGTDFQLLGECPTEEALPEAGQAIQQLRAQGLHVDARLMHVRFQSLTTGATLRGLFAVQCSSMPMSPVWQIVADGSWAPDNEYDEWLPLYLRIGKSTQSNQQWLQGEMQNRHVQQQQLNRNLKNSIAESNQAFDAYMGSLRDTDRSRDYISHMRSQTTLGQGTWVAENEGARVYETDSWGLEGPEGRIDHRAFNTTNFTGENPWDRGQLELVDTRAEYERYIANQ